MEQLLKKNPRIEVVDALRGFAVMAIILIAVIAAVVTPIINSAMESTKKKSCCMTNGGVWENNACVGASDEC